MCYAKPRFRLALLIAIFNRFYLENNRFAMALFWLSLPNSAKKVQTSPGAREMAVLVRHYLWIAATLSTKP